MQVKSGWNKSHQIRSLTQCLTAHVTRHFLFQADRGKMQLNKPKGRNKNSKCSWLKAKHNETEWQATPGPTPGSKRTGAWETHAWPSQHTQGLFSKRHHLPAALLSHACHTSSMAQAIITKSEEPSTALGSLYRGPRFLHLWCPVAGSNTVKGITSIQHTLHVMPS